MEQNENLRNVMELMELMELYLELNDLNSEVLLYCHDHE